MKYKLLALDLDGTTLTSENKILPEVKAAIEKAKQHLQVMIVTGRHHTAAKPYYLELGLDSQSICCNGTYIYDYPNKKVMVENSIPKDIGEQFITLAEKEKLKILMYVTDAMTISKTEPVEFIAKLEAWAENFADDIRPDIRRIDSFKQTLAENEYLWKFVVEGEPESVLEFTKLPFIQHNFSAEQSWSNRFDFAYKGNTKGARLQEFLAHNNISASEVIAVGDNFNDISMIEVAGLGAAMAHSADEVKASADFVTSEDNNGRGIIEVLEKFVY